ncbi:hypothetical protein [Brucella thiophenivorans]|uniref:ATP-binding protein n=1 Tax=Brucella thiophenivorans TaxID=571255 RepID=A0A256FW52_9HYPH|nr:hypothetical protein [Brucella thiophenivorans]OYR18970.1 hypothetical protein CEV31_2310 [Brucella thiophenivorans]
MKKINEKLKIRLIARAIKRWRRALNRKNKTHSRIPRQEVLISAPSILSFKDNFAETVQFLDAFRDGTLASDPKTTNVFIDLKSIKSLSVPVAIVLAAEFHRWSLVKKTRLRVRDSQQWDPTVRSLLSDLGVFELLGLKPVTLEFAPHNFTLTPLTSGVKTDGYKINQIQEQFRGVLEGFTANPEMFAGLMEAAENAINHAYPDNFTPRHPFADHRWWAASSLDLNTTSLRFFVFDQGAGIPFTLPQASLYENVRAKIASWTSDLIPNDSHMLRAALEVGRTRTGLSHRGLGLKRMSDVVTGAPNGYLRILSGKGEIVYHADDTIETRDHDYHIGGTLIEWSMNADAFKDSSEELPNENDQHR